MNFAGKVSGWKVDYFIAMAHAKSSSMSPFDVAMRRIHRFSLQSSSALKLCTQSTTRLALGITSTGLILQMAISRSDLAALLPNQICPEPCNSQCLIQHTHTRYTSSHFSLALDCSETPQFLTKGRHTHTHFSLALDCSETPQFLTKGRHIHTHFSLALDCSETPQFLTKGRHTYTLHELAFLAQQLRQIDSNTESFII
mgnify:CR=1 FL=1